MPGPMTEEQLEMTARFEECLRKLQAERKAGLITAVRLAAKAIEIDVDRAAWAQMPFDQKLAVVETVSCYAVVGNPDMHARVQVLDSRDRHELDYYNGSEMKVPD